MNNTLISDVLGSIPWNHTLQVLLLPFSSYPPTLLWEKESMELMDNVHQWYMHVRSLLHHVPDTWDQKIYLFNPSLDCFRACENFFPKAILLWADCPFIQHNFRLEDGGIEPRCIGECPYTCHPGPVVGGSVRVTRLFSCSQPHKCQEKSVWNFLIS